MYVFSNGAPHFCGGGQRGSDVCDGNAYGRVSDTKTRRWKSQSESVQTQKSILPPFLSSWGIQE